MSTRRHGGDAAAPATFHLLADRRLRLDVAPPLLHLVAAWLPALPALPALPDAGGNADAVPHGAARVQVAAGAPAQAATEPPLLRLFSARVWIDDETGHVSLHGSLSGSHGSVVLAGLSATLHAATGHAADADVAADVYAMLTVTCALLLGRLGRALVHAAAVVTPAGRAWLLVGDTHAGKTTTCANLLDAGWRYLSDDHVVLSPGADTGAGQVEGWPRPFHLDDGWRSGTPQQRRRAVSADETWPGQWQRVAPHAGLLFPRVVADQPTRLDTLSPADALSRLIRQSPWLLADRGAAPPVLALLQHAVTRPSYELRLGLDSFNDPRRLLDCLRLPDG
jgi:hypothetical protein